jgi:hypothetical protein
MKSLPKKPSIFFKDDTPETVELIKRLISLKYFVKRPEKKQLKIGPVNYWPTTGTITVDGGRRIVQKGTETLMRVLAKEFPPHTSHTRKRYVTQAAQTEWRPEQVLKLEDMFTQAEPTETRTVTATIDTATAPEEASKGETLGDWQANGIAARLTGV